MSAFLKPLTVAEFLAWERTQPLRYEFDGVQPVAMTGGSLSHARIITRITTALGITTALATRVRPPCEAFGAELKVLTPGRVRYPDASVVCGVDDDSGATIQPTVVFEVLSPSTALTDRRVKAAEYAAVPSIQVYVLLGSEQPEALVRGRTTGWDEEVIEAPGGMLHLPEIGVSVPLAEIYAPVRR